MLRGQELADFLKNARLQAGFSQIEVAETLGYKSSQFVSNWERGMSSPPIATLRRLCSLYKMNEAKMFYIIRNIAVRQVEAEIQHEFYAEEETAL